MAVSLRVRTPPGFDFAWAAGFLASRQVPALERLGPDSYRRSVRLANGAALVVRLTWHPGRRAGGHIAVAASGDAPASVLRALVRRMLDLGHDAAAFRRAVARDPVLGPVVRGNAAGVRLPQLPDPFEALVRAMLGQQISVAGARTLTGRLVRLAGAPLPLGALAEPGDRGVPDEAWAFPSPEALAAVPEGELRGLGVTAARARALRGVAAAVRDGDLSWRALRRLAPEARIAALCRLPGVGPWTAHYLGMRALGDADAFPAADLGVVKALAARGVPAPRIAATAERWRPWRAYAAVHLWESLATERASRRSA